MRSRAGGGGRILGGQLFAVGQHGSSLDDHLGRDQGVEFGALPVSPDIPHTIQRPVVAPVDLYLPDDSQALGPHAGAHGAGVVCRGVQGAVGGEKDQGQSAAVCAVDQMRQQVRVVEFVGGDRPVAVLVSQKRRQSPGRVVAGQVRDQGQHPVRDGDGKRQGDTVVVGHDVLSNMRERGHRPRWPMPASAGSISVVARGVPAGGRRPVSPADRRVVCAWRSPGRGGRPGDRRRVQRCRSCSVSAWCR